MMDIMHALATVTQRLALRLSMFKLEGARGIHRSRALCRPLSAGHHSYSARLACQLQCVTLLRIAGRLQPVIAAEALMDLYDQSDAAVDERGQAREVPPQELMTALIDGLGAVCEATAGATAGDAKLLKGLLSRMYSGRFALSSSDADLLTVTEQIQVGLESVPESVSQPIYTT